MQRKSDRVKTMQTCPTTCHGQAYEKLFWLHTRQI